ncbi:hypothetical protein ABEV54_22495 [Peribacillus psychrosaccharolyticus]|nr:hypothetical protein [Peribacillus psychrosaccharolyticus]MEC2054127.1 hypothetical protein [Peribacillus psychrosaccharolyticus]MED3742252.1 hypothetical protein [Peribacillus psychrosaccharolyticus]
MRVCELCGMEEELENVIESEQTRMLYLCEDCRNDRKTFIENRAY